MLLEQLLDFSKARILEKLEFGKIQMGIRPLRTSTAEEEKVHASTAGKKIAFERLLFLSQICLGPIGEDSGRTPADKVERPKNKMRAWTFFPP